MELIKGSAPGERLYFEPSPRTLSAAKGEEASGISFEDLDAMIAAGPNALLDRVLADGTQSSFQDSDGLISFVNMSSSFVNTSPEYKVGREVCDAISNFYATLRIKVFAYLTKNPGKVLPGDVVPTTQWDSAFTHYMQSMLAQAGGLTNYKVVTESYSVTQTLVNFSTNFLKLIFDAVAAPEAIVTQVTSFIQGVGETLRTSWDTQSKSFQIALLGQCHEAVPVDSTNQTFVYFPKVKYYFISVDSSQKAFTSSCVGVEQLTFDFRYEYYVTGLAAAVLDNTTALNAQFMGFLNKAQAVSYKDASNNLDAILDASSAGAKNEFLGDANVYGVNLNEYPKAEAARDHFVQTVLNRR